MSNYGIFAAHQLTPANSQVYEMITAGNSPIVLAVANEYVCAESDDAIVQMLIDSCTQWGQRYTQRDFTANQYTLLLDCFENPIELRRNPIAVIDSVEYFKEGSLETVAPSVYKLKLGVQVSSLILKKDQTWPTDVDEEEQSIKISFTTKAVGPDKLDMAKIAILRHVAYMFENKGDCGSCEDCADVAQVKTLYDSFRIVNI